MIKLGLTGSIGSGKSTTAAFFKAHGVPVFDSDHCVHELYFSEAVEAIRKIAPQSIDNNQVDRKILSKLIREQEGLLENVESIIHPMVYKKQDAFIKTAQQQNKSLVVFDIPLLFEKNRDSDFDVLVLVRCEFAEQKKRVMQREAMTEEKFLSLYNRQMPEQEKRKRSHYIIDTTFGLQHVEIEVAHLIKVLSRLQA